MSRIKRPSPALVISIMALVAAVAVPAYALTKSEKKVVKKLANAQITKRAPGLSVANAGKLDGQDAADFTPADEVQNSGRVVLNDPTTGDGLDNNVSTLFVAGAFTVQARCAVDVQGSGNNVAQVVVVGPQGTSFANMLSTTPPVNVPDASVGGAAFALAAAGNNVVGGGHLTAVASNGDVVSVSGSAEVGDPAGDCLFGATAIGP